MLSFCFPLHRVMAQLSLFDTPDPVAAAIAAMAASGHEDRGAVFTRREVVDFILDLIGYRSDRPLSRYRLLDAAQTDDRPRCRAIAHDIYGLSAAERVHMQTIAPH